MINCLKSDHYGQLVIFPTSTKIENQDILIRPISAGNIEKINEVSI